MGLDDEAWGVEFGVGFAESGDSAFAAECGGAEVDEQGLVEFEVHDLAQAVLHLSFFAISEVTLKNGILEVLSVAFADFEDFAQAFFVSDVVGNNVVAAHGWWWRGGVVGGWVVEGWRGGVVEGWRGYGFDDILEMKALICFRRESRLIRRLFAF